ATSLARTMVTQWGMSDKLGPLMYGENQEEVFLGHSIARTQNVSEETARLIDAEVKRIVMESYERAKTILTENKEDLHKIAKALLEFETLNGEEIKALTEGKTIERRDVEDDAPPPSATGVSAVPNTGGRSFGDPEPQPQG